MRSCTLVGLRCMFLKLGLAGDDTAPPLKLGLAGDDTAPGGAVAGEGELASGVNAHLGVLGLAGEQTWVATPAVDVSALTGVVGSPASLAF